MSQDVYTMKRDFRIIGGIHLVQEAYRLDMHNRFSFTDLAYSVSERTLTLVWRRSDRVRPDTEYPRMVQIRFMGVQEFRFTPRSSKMPFTEDDCISTFGYWTDEDWSNGVIMTDEHERADPNWLTAISFMSRAIVMVQAESACAIIQE